MKRGLFLIDALLVPVFVLTAYSGIILHVCRENQHNDVAEELFFHGISSFVFAVLVAWHVWVHWRWYCNLYRTLRFGWRSTMTLLLSVGVTVLVVTGVGMLLGRPAALLERGHGVTAVFVVLLGGIHMVGRFRILVRGVKTTFCRRMTE